MLVEVLTAKVNISGIAEEAHYVRPSLSTFPINFTLTTTISVHSNGDSPIASCLLQALHQLRVLFETIFLVHIADITVGLNPEIVYSLPLLCASCLLTPYFTSMSPLLPFRLLPLRTFPVDPRSPSPTIAVLVIQTPHRILLPQAPEQSSRCQHRQNRTAAS